MLFSPRIDLKPLAWLCRRLSISLSAGVDIRRTLQREAESARGPLRHRLTAIQSAVNRGTTFSEAVAATGNYFPTLFRELVAVGDQTGNLAEVLRELADQYDEQLTRKRAFLSALTWPMIELSASVFIVAFLIWIAEVIGVDVLGLGLVGTNGLIKYFTFIGFVVAGIWVLIQAAKREYLWLKPIEAIVSRIPVLGRIHETLSVARLTWAMSVTLGSAMELRKAIELSLRGSHNSRYAGAADDIWRRIMRGGSLYQAMLETRIFPPRLLDAIAVGEESGSLPETLDRLSRHYADEARTALMILSRIAGFVVWGIVAMIIVSLIFQIFGGYVQMINNAAKGKF
jgi:type II secretory pathway component PulF